MSVSSWCFFILATVKGRCRRQQSSAAWLLKDKSFAVYLHHHRPVVKLVILQGSVSLQLSGSFTHSVSQPPASHPNLYFSSLSKAAVFSESCRWHLHTKPLECLWTCHGNAKAQPIGGGKDGGIAHKQGNVLWEVKSFSLHANRNKIAFVLFQAFLTFVITS